MRKRYNICACLLFLLCTCLYCDQVTQYHYVKQGENLSSIARKYNTTSSNIKKLNNLKSSVIYPKQKLAVKKVLTQQARTETLSASGGAKWGYDTTFHTVKKGDTLSGLSRKYGVSISAIKKANNLRSSNIVIGRTLKINTPRRMPDIDAPKPIMGELSEKIYHKIQKGDTLEALAKKYNTSPEHLKEANLLSDSDIKEGQMIVIPSLPVSDNSASESNIHQEAKLRDALLKESFSFLDMPYRLGGAGSTSIDCSTLTKLVYKSIGISLPNTSFLQFQEGEAVLKEELSEGDLVFFNRRGFIGHVGIYIGNGLFIHASSNEKKVTIASLENSYFRRNFAGGRRYVPADESLLARRFGNAVSE
ncbi:MAG: LysM peptidoglycan-binding domain-containing protein [Candidatus Omnitrophica bacterium]|nr:LysM peptidoglycan-binding domain-containing protein [Candidatus Omnitrophota bacterium]